MVETKLHRLYYSLIKKKSFFQMQRWLFAKRAINKWENSPTYRNIMVLSSFMGGSNMSKVLNNFLSVLSLPGTRFTSAKQGRHFPQNSSSTTQQSFVYSSSLHPIYGSDCAADLLWPPKPNSRDVAGNYKVFV